MTNTCIVQPRLSGLAWTRRKHFDNRGNLLAYPFTVKHLYFVGYILCESVGKLDFARSIFGKTVFEEVHCRGGGRWHSTHASIIKLFIAEKLAYPPRVVFWSKLFSPVSWRTNPDISQLPKEMASDGIRPEREQFGFESALLGAFLKY